jgi:peroxiredoxin (alkyl hydroperoxide reductase subunit C)
MSLVGKKTPIFSTAAVLNGNKVIKNFTLEQFLGKQDVVLFFYPKDFNTSCSTEILAFQEKLIEFEKRNVALIGVSTDTEESHLAWLATPTDKGGIENVTFTLAADNSKTIANNFGVLAGDWDYDDAGQLSFVGEPIAYKGTFIIDKTGIVRQETINDFSLVRNIDEIIRHLDNLQKSENQTKNKPGNWKKGGKEKI